MIQIHRASAIHQDTAEVVLNREERGTIESDVALTVNTSTSRSVLRSIYNRWSREKHSNTKTKRTKHTFTS